jgi:hypothetical protein
MSYSITVPAGADGLLTASPVSGVLGDGQSATITLTLSRPVTVDDKVVIDPGGLSLTVTYTPPRQTSPPPGNRAM